MPKATREVARHRLFRQFILRPLISEKIRTITTVLGVSLGIAVVIAIQLTNASSVRGFETALETVAGKTAIEIIGAGTGVDENLLPELSWLREFGIISPVIEGSAALVVGDVKQLSRRQMEAVKILGIDILRDQPFRDYQLLEIQQASRLAGQQASGPTGQQARTSVSRLQYPTVPRDPDERSRRVVITEKLATRRNYPLGSTLRLMIGDRVLPFVVRGILKNEGPARVLDGNFIMMDIAAAQLAFDRLGRVDRIDVLLPRRRRSCIAISRRSRSGCRPRVSAQRPSRRSEQVETMLAAFHTNLTALSWIALIVGLFLVYNTVTISVVARRQEIGTLRALGLSRNKVLLLFLGEAAALAVAGIAIGLGLARLLADAAVTMTASTVSTLYIAAVSAPPEMNICHLWIAIAIGLPLSLIAAAIPALEASRVPPTAAMRGHDTLDMRRPLQAGRAGRRLRVSRRRLRAGAAAADRPAPGLRLHVVVRDRDRRRVHGAGDHVWPGAARADDAAATARRRRPARARQPDLGDSAPVDLGRRALGEPGDDGRDRRDDRQLPRHRRLLGRPDAARPTFSSAPASGRRSAPSRRYRKT